MLTIQRVVERPALPGGAPAPLLGCGRLTWVDAEIRSVAGLCPRRRPARACQWPIRRPGRSRITRRLSLRLLRSSQHHGTERGTVAPIEIRGHTRRRESVYGPGRTRLLDDLIGPLEERGRDREPERVGGLGVDDQLGLRRLLDGEVGGLGALRDLIDDCRRTAERVREVSC